MTKQRPTPLPTARDRGAATVWAAGAIAALLAITTLVVWLGAAAATRHRATSAADMAALAAAGVAVEGERVACGKARWVTDRMEVGLRSCGLDGSEARVEVVAEPPGVLAGFGPAEARARAGPVVERLAQVERSSSDGKRHSRRSENPVQRLTRLQPCLSRYSFTVS
ncbi:Rv3654c family TadE-like protein [Actinophytocola sp.]|uniref:Rv3654c family TadE-like protein n=1 Tax=Actinophytocola sp. TaxID=1872138 RepID=UPI003D6A7544